VLAVRTDIDHLDVKLNAAAGLTMSQSILKAAITSGVNSVTFKGVPAGTVTITVTAFDASGAVIGTASKVGAAVAGQASTIAMLLRLIPSYVSGAPVVAGSNTTGDVNASISIADGPVFTGSPNGSATFVDLDFPPQAVADDGAGHAWVAGGDGGSIFVSGSVASGRLIKVGADGTILASFTTNEPLVGMVVDGNGLPTVIAQVATGSYAVLTFDGNGVLINRVPIATGTAHLLDVDRDSAGTLYLMLSTGLYRYNTTSGLQAMSGLLPGATDTSVGLNQDLWLCAAQTSTVARYSRSGVLIGNCAMATDRFPEKSVVDALGNTWVTAEKVNQASFGNVPPVDSGQVYKYGPDGALSGIFNVLGEGHVTDVVAGPDGDVWVQAGATINRLSSAGQLKSTVKFPSFGGFDHIAVGAGGAWRITTSGNTLVRLVL
jgi:hypothetical protein